eukprot:4745437-Amphidinium_carterae.1
MFTNTTGSTIVQTIASIYTSTLGGMRQWTIRTMGSIRQSTCWFVRLQSTMSWPTVTRKPMHILQFTSAGQRTSQLSSIQSSLDRIQ